MRRLLIKISTLIPTRLYLRLMFFKHFKRGFSFKNPKSLNEKIQWLKIYDKDERYTKLVDKYEVREYISNILGEEYLIPLIGVWDSVEEIEYENLPNQFVLKCNHDSKSVYICKNKKEFDFNKVKKDINKKLKRNGYWYGREWPYKNIKPRIIAEKYMVDESGIELKDYKIMCFNGEPNNIMVCYDRKGTQAKHKYFDLEWNLLNYNKKEKDIDIDIDKTDRIQKPKSLEEMIRIAKILSKNTLFTRIDLYDINGKVYFGEITFYPASGLKKDITLETDYELGEKLKLPINQ